MKQIFILMTASLGLFACANEQTQPQAAPAPKPPAIAALPAPLPNSELRTPNSPAPRSPLPASPSPLQKITQTEENIAAFPVWLYNQLAWPGFTLSLPGVTFTVKPRAAAGSAASVSPSPTPKPAK